MLVFRALLWLYPRAFRERFRDELEQLVVSMSTEPRHAGRAGRLRLLSAIAKDVVRTAVRQRIRQIGGALRSPDVPQQPADPQRSEMDTVLQDIGYAFRQFVRRPGFAAVAVVSLALGIGGNSLIYGLVDGYVINPFPYPDAERLVAVGVSFPKLSTETRYVEILSPAEYFDIRASRSFSAAAAFDLGNRNVSGGDIPERVFTALLVDDLFPVIGMPAQVGRGFSRDELAPGGPRVAIISNRLWHSRFGADPNILNRTIRIGGEATAIVGVMPPGLLLIGTDLWLPWGGDAAKMPRNTRQFTILARLAPGATLREANAELGTLAGRIDQNYRASFKEYEGWRLTASPWANALLQDLRPAAFLLLGAVGLVLLIACANLTNLFLARSTTRQRELAVRLALGAGRGRIARTLLTESVLLALAGAAVGVTLAYAGLRGAAALIPAQMQTLDLHATVNTRVLLWSLGLALATGIVVGLVPAVHATRMDPHEALKADGRSGASRSGSRLRTALVVAEIALSVVLLIGAGLLMRTFSNIQNVDAGFDARGVLTMRMTLPRERYRGEEPNAFFDRLIERLSALPNVRAVSAASQFPPNATFQTEFTLDRPPVETAGISTAIITVATPGHFEALRVPMRSGRTFSAMDNLTAPPVAIVNQAFVDRHLAGRDPIGQRLALGDPQRERAWTTIVGVVADFRQGGSAQPVRPSIFMPMRQQTAWNQLFVLVRGDGEPASLLPSVREAVRSLDPEQPIYAVQTLQDAVAQSSFQQRIAAMLLSAFAAVALVLAAVGIFGVLSYTVSARTQEIGIRLAVGAEPRDVRWLIVGQVLRMVVIGLVIGTGVLLAAGRAMAGLLFGVTAADPVTIGAVAGILGAVAVIAAWVPAARASRVDPIQALRNE